MNELLSLLRARPLLTGELLIASLFINVLSLAPSLFFILVFNRYVNSGFDGTLITLTTGMLLAVALKCLFGLARSRLAEDVTGDREPFRLHVAFQHLLRARMSSLGTMSKAHLLDAIQGPQAVQTACSPQNITAVLDAPFAVLSVFLVFLLSPALGFVTAAALLAIILISIFGLRSARMPARDVGEAVATGRLVASQALLEPETVRCFGGQAHLLRAWDGQVMRLQMLRRSVLRAEVWSQTGVEAATLLTRASVIALGAKLVVQGELSVGALIGASYLAGMPLGMVSRFIRSVSVLNTAQVQTERFRQIAGLPLEPDQGLAMDVCKGRLDFQDLAFAWPGAPGPLFESVTLRIDAGGFLAVTGRNGTGKTTLARMLVGLLEPVRGQILIDGLDLRQIAPAWWRKRIIYLPQEPSFIKASVLENIRLANPDMTDEDVQRVVLQAGLRPFLNAHPLGHELIVEDGGRRLAPGIRRRLALARALATDGEVAVLDDPTEALDAEGCKTVIEAIRVLAERKKTLVVFTNDMRILSLAGVYLDLNCKPVPRVSAPGQDQGTKP